MFNRRITVMIAGAFILPLALFASDPVIPDLDQELAHNKVLVSEYKAAIKRLEKRNQYLVEQKRKNPKLYETKPLYEETKNAYIHRIKLNGAEAKNISFTVKDHMVSLEMNIKTERTDKESYYSSSQYFYQSYRIPENVKENKIHHNVDGDYFVITMPKK